MDTESAIRRAVSIGGGQSELARKIRALGKRVSQQSISAWVIADELPEGKDWAVWIARAVDFQITPHDLDKAAYPNAWDGLPAERARAFVEEKVAA
jgi:DNA-binding transcriptional regulator YdaS (Cro superfamily)